MAKRARLLAMGLQRPQQDRLAAEEGERGSDSGLPVPHRFVLRERTPHRPPEQPPHHQRERQIEPDQRVGGAPDEVAHLAVVADDDPVAVAGSRAPPDGETAPEARAASPCPRTAHRARSGAGHGLRRQALGQPALARSRGAEDNNAPHPLRDCSVKPAASVGLRAAFEGASMSQILFRNFNLLDPRWDEAARRLRGAGRGRHHQGSVRQADQRRQGAGDRRRQAHPDARPDRLPRPRLPDRSEYPPSRGDPAHPAHGQVGRPDARHDRPRLHHGARHRRRRLGHQDGRRDGPDPRPAPVHLGQGHRPDRRPYRLAPPHGLPAGLVRLLQRHGLCDGCRRRRGRGAQVRCASRCGRARTRSRSCARAASRRPTTRSIRCSSPRPRSRRRPTKPGISAAMCWPTPIRRKPSPGR